MEIVAHDNVFHRTMVTITIDVARALAKSGKILTEKSKLALLNNRAMITRGITRYPSVHKHIPTLRVSMQFSTSFHCR